jgi:hypothetical protein
MGPPERVTSVGNAMIAGLSLWVKSAVGDEAWA